MVQEAWFRYNASNKASSPQCKSLGGKLNDLIGKQDAAIIADPQGRIIFSKNADKNLIPASLLKILTALVALHYLGPDFRFKTEFYLDQDSNLKVKGYGDPLLTSEIIAEIAKGLGERLIKINDLVLDDSYFKQPIIIPGISSTAEPYDAPNGALCANFNTVCFKRTHNGSYVSAEPQTPLLSLALKRIKTSGLKEGRIVLSHQENDIILYTGHLLLCFMEKEGIQLSGRIRTGTVREEKDKLIFKYISRFSLKQVISNLLEYSNNFIANQLLMAAGAKAYGPPATLAKGVSATLSYAKNILKIENICIVEGSGISRANRMSAAHLYQILGKFEPYYLLMRKKDTEFYKTGTLSGIRTRAGYIKNGKKELYRFVVLINTPGKSTERIMEKLRQAVTSKP
ncbi:MAG: hypothetical protein AUJ48_04615 [Deltaproteobacteria bacterium CG1_02_45_11]|nr:MAG: hypothetical protein AUJ48_04615 [Deltaproteobacteria bacterium CG1_02_45_11]